MTMAGAAMRWLPVLLYCAAVAALPLPEELDSPDSRKVLGSSVVTSVSVLMENENGTKTAYFADAAGHPVKRPHEGADIGSPVDLLTPDKYQYYTFDGSGNIIKRFMTKEEVRSIIANGQKSNEMQSDQPTFYHNMPAPHQDLAFEPTEEETPEHFAQAQMKMHSVVASVQNVLKTQMDDKVEAAVQPPMTPDTSATWSMILPGFGNDADDASTKTPEVHAEEPSTNLPETSVSHGAPDAVADTGSGMSDSDGSEEQETLSTSSPAQSTSTQEPTQKTSTSEPSSSSEESESDESSESSEVTKQDTTPVKTESPEDVESTESTIQDASIAESDSTEADHSGGESTHMADAPASSVSEDVSILSGFSESEFPSTHMELKPLALTKPLLESGSSEASTSDETVKHPTHQDISSHTSMSDENNSSINKVIHSHEKLNALNKNNESQLNDTSKPISEKPEKDEDVHVESDESHADEVDDVLTQTEAIPRTTESKESSSEESETPTPTATETPSNVSDPEPILQDINVSEQLAPALSDILTAVGQEALSSITDEDVNSTTQEPEEDADKTTEVVVTSVSSSHSSHSSTSSVSSQIDLEPTTDGSGDEDSTTIKEEQTVAPGSKDHDGVASESVHVLLSSSNTSDKNNLMHHNIHQVFDEVKKVEMVPLTESSHDEHVHVPSDEVEATTNISEATDDIEHATPTTNNLDVENGINEEETTTIFTKSHIADKKDAVGYNSDLPTTFHDDVTQKIDESATEDDIIPISEENTDKPSLAEETTAGREGSGEESSEHPDESAETPEGSGWSPTESPSTKNEGSGEDSIEHPTEAEETPEGSGWSGTESSPKRNEGSGSGDDTEHSEELTTKAHKLEHADIYDVMNYGTSDKDIGVTPPQAQLEAETNKNAGDIFDVEEYGKSPIDIGLTTPVYDKETTTFNRHSELNDEAIQFDHSGTDDINNDEMSAENIAVNTHHVTDATDRDVTTSASDADAQNDAKKPESADDMHDVFNYLNSDKDLGVTTPVSEENSQTDVTKADNADDMHNVINYANSDTDLGVTTTSSVEDAHTDKNSDREQNDENASGGNIYDVHRYAESDADLGVTTPLTDDSTQPDNAADIYDVNNYVQSDKDLGVTTTSSVDETQTEKDDVQDLTGGKTETTQEVTNSVEENADSDITTVPSSEKSSVKSQETASHSIQDASNDHVINEDVTKEDVTKENVTKEVVSKEDVTKEDVTKENVTIEVVTKQDVTKEDVTKEDVTKEVVSKEDVTKEDVTKENVTIEAVTKQDVTKEDVTKEDVTEEEVTKEDISRKEATLENVTKEDETNDNATKEDVTKEKINTIPTKVTSSAEGVHTPISSDASDVSKDNEDAETTTTFDADIEMNDQPNSSTSSGETTDDKPGEESTENIQYYKPPLEGGMIRKEADKMKLSPGGTNWMKVDIIPSPMKESHTMPASVELDPAPQESLGLEASTVHLFEDVQKFADLCNELAFKMWMSMTEKGMSTSRSIIMSPFATTSMLSMVFLGARGPTSGQMNDVLKLDDMMTFNPHQVFMNVTQSVLMENPGVSTAAFVREIYSDVSKGKMLDFYKQRVTQFYDGHVEEVDFANIGDTLRRRTNLFVKRQTNGRISEYMRGSSLELQPPLAAFSANIFQTDCSSATTEGRDGEMYFTILPATRQRRLVPIPSVVYRSGFMAGYEPGLDATVVSLGSHDSAISTLFVLPGQQGHLAPGDGLPRLEARLINSSYSEGTWSKLLRSLLPRTGLEVQIPRFSHRSQLNITHSLQSMGLNDLFDPTSADLKGLSGTSNDLHVSDVIQVNTFSTCGEEMIGSRHHVEVYPSGPNRSARHEEEESLESVPLMLRPRQARLDVNQGPSGFEDLVQDSIYQMPLALRPRQARIPEGEESVPRLKLDRPFLYFVRHNPTGFILHMGRFNPRLLH